MGMPMLIGAGIGAIGGAAMGKNPLKTALIGGALGSLGSASGLLGGATGTTGVGGLTSALPEAAADLAAPSTSLLTNTAIPSVGIPASAYSAAPMGIELSVAPTSQALGEGLGYTISPSTIAMGGATSAMTPLAPTFMDKLANMGSNTFNWMKDNPSTTLGAANLYTQMANAPKQKLEQAPSAGISKGGGNIQYQPINTGEIPQFKYPHSLLLGY